VDLRLRYEEFSPGNAPGFFYPQFPREFLKINT
jgi:hypothetical protein